MTARASAESAEFEEILRGVARVQPIFASPRVRWR